MYGFSITFFSRIEVSYVCVLYMGKDDVGFWPEETWGKYTNQDRHFAARVQLLKEGEFGIDWIPSVVFGMSDPYTLGLTNPEDIASRPGNGFLIEPIYVLQSISQPIMERLCSPWVSV